MSVSFHLAVKLSSPQLISGQSWSAHIHLLVVTFHSIFICWHSECSLSNLGFFPLLSILYMLRKPIL